MALDKMRRFVFALAAVALFLATVMPRMDINVNAADSSPMMTMAAMDGMNCPDCDMSQDKMAGCMQATCIGFAVVTEGGCFEATPARSVFAIAAVVWPDDLKSAPSTPPI